MSDYHNFATGLRRDRDAVYEAIHQPNSNGRTEGHVNRLKLIKRNDSYGIEGGLYDQLQLKGRHISNKLLRFQHPWDYFCKFMFAQMTAKYAHGFRKLLTKLGGNLG
ncbi:MAG TPA: transposase [Anaerolineae bacterium]|nr:transposase [Anaerolineae bacterium]